MFKSALLVVLMAMYSAASFGQVTIGYGETYKSKPIDTDYIYAPKIVDADTDGYTVMTQDGDEMILRRFSSNHKLLEENKQEYTAGGQPFRPERFVRLGGVMYAVQSAYNTRSKRWELSTARVDGANFADIATPVSHPFKKQYRRGGAAYYGLSYSGDLIVNDGGSAAVFVNMLNDLPDKDGTAMIRIVMLNGMLEEEWTKDISIKAFGKKTGNVAAKLSSDGTLYLLRSYKDNELPSGSQLILGTITETAEMFQSLDFDQGKYQGIYLLPNTDSPGCRVIGTYEANKKKQKSAGWYQFEVIPGTERIRATVLPFTDEEIGEELQKWYSKGESFDRKIAVAADGVVTMTMAKSYSVRTDNGHTEYRTENLYVLKALPGATVIPISRIEFKSSPWNKRNIFMDQIFFKDKEYIIYSGYAGSSHSLRMAEIGPGAEILGDIEIVRKMNKANESLWQGNLRVVDDRLLMLLGYYKEATGSYVEID